MHLFWAPITGTAEPKVFKFCTRVGNINSMQQDDISRTKRRGYGHVTVLNFALSRDAAPRAGLSAKSDHGQSVQIFSGPGRANVCVCVCVYSKYFT